MKSVKLLTVVPGNCLNNVCKNFSTSVSLQVKHFKILVVGAGAGGCSVANKFASHLGADKVGIIEPKDVCIILFSEL
jgi:malic enzyme